MKASKGKLLGMALLIIVALPATREAVHAAGRQRVASPMPAKLVRVLVAEGDESRSARAWWWSRP